MKSYKKLDTPIFHGSQKGYGKSVRYVVSELTILDNNNKREIEARIVKVFGMRKNTFQLWFDGISQITDAKSEEQLLAYLPKLRPNLSIV